MPTSITDATRQAGVRSWEPNPLSVCTLKKAFHGTFCFPWGPEFGCGSSINISKGESKTLSNGFTAGGVTIGTSVTFSASTAWSHKSDRCEWCKPTICYPNSWLKTWTCENFIDFTSWFTTRTTFQPGRAKITPGCVKNAKECNCTETAMTENVGEGGYIADLEDSAITTLISTASFQRRPGEPVDSDPKEDLIAAFNSVESFANQISPDDPEPQSVVVATPGNEKVVLKGPNVTKNKLALLSSDCSDTSSGGVKVQPGGILSILAVGAHVPNAKAKVIIEEHGNDSTKIITEEDAPLMSGQFTTIWTQIKLDQNTFKPKSRGHLLVKLYDENNHLTASLKEPIITSNLKQ